MGIRSPDFFLEVTSSTFSEQVASILTRVDKVIGDTSPERVLILGDTNSGLASVVAARRGIPVYHLEAGNRCYDDRVPEEVNRRIIDHTSTILMPYTNRSKDNLIREGISRERIVVVGNPIFEVMNSFIDRIDASDILSRLGLEAGGFFLVTAHRAENVDNAERMRDLARGWDAIAARWKLPVIISVHPRTADRLDRFGLAPDSDLVRLLEPVGFFDFSRLERNARCVITDSGTVQEECCILRVRNVTVRDTTERPETIECGSNVLAGVRPESVTKAVDMVLQSRCDWDPPVEYLATNVAERVARIVASPIVRDISVV
jgi:UDP-N-acetylglucosamine 2-epimerase (non-hydrolysing)